MKKKIMTLLLIFLAITSVLTGVSAQNETDIEIKSTNETEITAESETKSNEKSTNESDRIGETVKSNDDDYLNISFDDGYNGYCINKGWKGAKTGEEFTVKNTSAAISNVNGAEIGNYIKILFVDFHDEVTKNAKLAQNVIWSFSNNYYTHDYLDYVNKIIDIANSGRVIADHGETITINNTTKATFDFEVLSSGRSLHQNFFGYKITYSDIIPEITDNDNNTADNESQENETNNTPTPDKPVLGQTEKNNTTATNDSEISNNEEVNPESSESVPGQPAPETTVAKKINNNMKSNDDYNTNNATDSITSVDSDNPKNNVDLRNHATGRTTTIVLIVLTILGFILVIRHGRD